MSKIEGALISLLLLAAIGPSLQNKALASAAIVSENYDLADENEPHGRIASITPAEMRAIMAASKELEKLSLDLTKYKSVHVRETRKYVYVMFSPHGEGFTGTGNLPGQQAGIEMQIDVETLQIGGSKR